MLTEQDLVEKIKDKWWRLNNLYWIKPKTGKDSSLIQFRPNWAQTELFNDLWTRNVVLKARQLGVTTFFSIFFLDDCIFNRNVREILFWNKTLTSHTHSETIRRSTKPVPFFDERRVVWRRTGGSMFLHLLLS